MNKRPLSRFRLYLPQDLVEYVTSQPEGISRFIEQTLREQLKQEAAEDKGGHLESQSNSDKTPHPN